MTLRSGTRLGAYEIVAPLGSGGMGEVYRARDTKLERDVALKILPDLFACDAERLARFEREAKTLAALNHPHIAQIHGLEESGGVRALVMELVEGEDLAQRIARGAIPLDEALGIAKQIADALDAAHERGIIHRDLKPANIKLRPDGTVKVLDFGLAKATAPTAAGVANSPTFTVAATQMGMIVGTAAYMAPEQARGKAVDKRADVWAFGCVLYEMLTGRPVFRGEAVSDLVAAIMRDSPSLSELPASTPEHVRRLIARCLQKAPTDRLRDLGDARLYLEDAAIHEVVASAGRRTRQHWLIAALAASTVMAGSLAAWLWTRSAVGAGPVMRMIVPAPGLSRRSAPALSPTGDRIAFVGDGRLWVRLFADSMARPIAGTEGAVQPFWSADGRQIGYFVGPRIFTVAVDGGSPALLAQMDRACAAPVCAGYWGEDGRILVSAGFGDVLAVSERGGALVEYIPAGDRDHYHEVWGLPGGRGALATVDPDDGSEWIAIWDGRQRRKLVDNAVRGVYSPSGHVVFSRSNGLWAIPFSLDRLEAAGEPFLVSELASEPTVARDGTLLYLAAGRREQHLVWVDRDGAIRETVGTYEGSASAPDVSPDGRRVAFVSQAEGRGQIWIFEPARGIRTPLAREASTYASPVWTADGSGLYYVAIKPGEIDAEHQAIHVARLGGSRPTGLVAHGYEPSASRDGRYLTFTSGDAAVRRIEYLDLRDAAARPKPFAPGAGISGSASLSPDGRFVAYVAGDWTSGRFEVYVSEFPDGRERAQVSSGGIGYQTQIRWNSRGDRLYYVRNADGSLMEVTVRLAGGVQLSPPRPLFAESAATLNLATGFAVSDDGSQFLVVRESVPHRAEAGGFMLVRNWSAEFRR